MMCWMYSMCIDHSLYKKLVFLLFNRWTKTMSEYLKQIFVLQKLTQLLWVWKDMGRAL